MSFKEGQVYNFHSLIEDFKEYNDHWVRVVFVPPAVSLNPYIKVKFHDGHTVDGVTTWWAETDELHETPEHDYPLTADERVNKAIEYLKNVDDLDESWATEGLTDLLDILEGRA